MDLLDKLRQLSSLALGKRPGDAIPSASIDSHLIHGRHCGQSKFGTVGSWVWSVLLVRSIGETL
jgi:hypothetical protein